MLYLKSRVWSNVTNIENRLDIKENCKFSSQVKILVLAILKQMQNSSTEVNRFPSDFAQHKQGQSLALL